MSNVNKVILMGRLGSDPEVRTLESGTLVANVSLATSESYTDKSGNKQEITEWHRLEFWDPLSKIVQQYCKKGDLLFVEGKIKTDNWTDKDGQQRKTQKIRVQALQLMPKSSGSVPKESDPVDMPKSSSTPVSEPVEDDLPF
jgi:single-strand DNA-binding protein